MDYFQFMLSEELPILKNKTTTKRDIVFFILEEENTFYS